jgi:large subunit ribosomal protein L3
MNGILARKIGMTRVFKENGESVPVTVVEAGPCKIVNIRTGEKNGYTAVQIGFDVVKLTKLNKPMQGYFRKNGFEDGFRILKEFRVSSIEGFKIGDEVNAGIFKPGDIVKVTGVSKGRGFAGGVKRHHFHGGPASHGSMAHRRPGSIGTNTFPGRVLKNKKLPGHMGNKRVTIKNIEVHSVIADKNLILLKGAVPGGTNSLLIIRKSDAA